MSVTSVYDHGRRDFRLWHTGPGRDPPRQARRGTGGVNARNAARSGEAETGYLEPSDSSLSRDKPARGCEKEMHDGEHDQALAESVSRRTTLSARGATEMEAQDYDTMRGLR